MSHEFHSAAAEGLPIGAVMMPRPQPIPGVPPGLEYLTTIDQVLIQQQVNLLEGRQLLLGLNINVPRIEATISDAVYKTHNIRPTEIAENGQ